MLATQGKRYLHTSLKGTLPSISATELLLQFFLIIAETVIFFAFCNKNLCTAMFYSNWNESFVFQFTTCWPEVLTPLVYCFKISIIFRQGEPAEFHADVVSLCNLDFAGEKIITFNIKNFVP